jgi:2-keto-4-pentenoate hydratase/2-oxohepta-3-ene-1,7-dioic acid hydratase in catechol pathway
MKLLFFDDFKLGVMNGDNVVDVSSIVQDIPHSDPQGLMRGLIERWDQYKPRLEAAAKGSGVPVSGVRIRPPLPKPANIDCMAVNYMENGTRSEPAEINAFHKSPLAIIGNGDTMVLPDVPATIFEGEAEMALVIGKPAKNVPAAQAMDYIFGYINFIDGSARGVGTGFYQMKSRDTFAPIGPFLVTADEVGDPQNLAVKLSVNGVLKQDFNTNDMAHKIPRCVEFVSHIHPLEPGDFIPTGTNHRGLNAFQDGDLVELETEGLGKLTIHVKDDLKRTWGRDTRLERQEAGLDGTTPQLTGKYA